MNIKSVCLIVLLLVNYICAEKLNSRNEYKSAESSRKVEDLESNRNQLVYQKISVQKKNRLKDYPDPHAFGVHSKCPNGYERIGNMCRVFPKNTSDSLVD